MASASVGSITLGAEARSGIWTIARPRSALSLLVLLERADDVAPRVPTQELRQDRRRRSLSAPPTGRQRRSRTTSAATSPARQSRQVFDRRLRAARSPSHVVPWRGG